MHLDLDAPRRMSTRRGEQLAFAQLSRITRRIRGQARGGHILYAPPKLPLKFGELCGKTRHTFFGSARLVSGPYYNIASVWLILQLLVYNFVINYVRTGRDTLPPRAGM